MHTLSAAEGARSAVLLHGMEASWRGWERLAARLGDRYRLTALEMPWHTGNAYRWTRHRSPGGWVADAVDALPERPDVVVAHSFAASATLEALADGLFARAVVLLAPFYCPPEHRVSWEMFDATRAAFEGLITDSLRGWLGRHGKPGADPRVLSGMADKLVDRMGPLAFTEWFRQFTATAGLDLAAVATPTLVLTGPRDLGLAGGRDEALAKAMPAAAVRVEPDYDHFGHIRTPARVAEIIDEFTTGALGPVQTKETAR
ncbi:alpha/beta fold hydrolase [Actinokineospora enzanensis]|uniref:alpha/beta fold hydrolase n=1 Tax=Actinokineospora enzanensis TaxID=155975 RepID=UPI0003A9A557|nr:alpha/beta hydrolase [Actinokineospora enzanensis]